MAATMIDPATQPDDPPVLRTALSLLRRGLWPIPIHAPGLRIGTLKDGTPRLSKGKEPIGEQWGLTPWTEATLRALYTAHPDANLGIKLGSEGGVIDIEADGDPAEAEATLLGLMGGEVIKTLGWTSERGWHLLFAFQERLRKYKPIIKGDWLPGLEIRIGAMGSGGKQYQSVCPPSRSVDGKARQWNGHDTIAPLPDAFFAFLDSHMPRPGPKVARPRILKFAGPRPAGSWDVEDVTQAIKGHYKELAAEWGLRLTGKVFDGDWAECHAIDREDLNPSAGLNLTSGVYHDFGSNGAGLSFFNLAIALGAFPDFPTAVNSLGQQFGVTQANVKSGKSSFEGSEGSEGHSKSNTGKGPPSWKPPRLHQTLEAVPFPLDVLPTTLADLCREGAKSVQCPVDYFAAAALALAGAAIGLSVNFTLKAHYHVAPNLYLAIVGPPGTKKTPVFLILNKPFYAIDRILREAYKQDLDEYEDHRRDYEANKRKGDAGPPPVAPIQSQLTLDDTTREAVALVHAENPRGLVLIKDELTSWVAALDAYRQGKGDDKQFWLKVNSGALVKVTRKVNRVEIVIPQPCVTIVGGLTPDSLPTIRAYRGDDGWLDRILFAYPEPLQSEDWSEEEIPEALTEDWHSAIFRLWDRKMVLDESGRLRPYFIHFKDGNKALWREWINAHRRETRDPDFPRSLHGPWSKMEGFAARLALILSQLHWAYDVGNTGPPPDVDPLAIWGACKLADYFKAHFRRARTDILRRSDLPDDCEALLKWFRHSGRESFSERDAKLNFRGRFARNPLALSDALEWLLARDCIRLVPSDPKVGRPPSPVYEINPALLHGYPQEEEDY